MGRLYDTHKWRKLRNAILRSGPLCVRCSNMGKVQLASVVDHCIPSREYDSFFDNDNLFSVCVQCHSDVTKHYDNRNAHRIFTSNYHSIKYSGREFTRDDTGFPLDEELDKKLVDLEVVGTKDTAPYFESFER